MINVARRFHYIVSFVTFCHVLDTLGTIEAIYNELLHQDGGLFVANNLNATTLAAADHEAGTHDTGGHGTAAFAKLAAVLRGQGFDVHVHEERPDNARRPRSIQRLPPRHDSSLSRGSPRRCVSAACVCLCAGARAGCARRAVPVACDRSLRCQCVDLLDDETTPSLASHPRPLERGGVASRVCTGAGSCPG